MALLPLLLAAATAAQTAATPVARYGGRAFISPMGEPFRPTTRDTSGLALWFTQADRNHDGRLTLDEMQADADRFFALLDVGHDGEIDPDDIVRYETVVAPEIASGSAHDLLGLPEPVTTADTNFNRGVSVEEFRQAAGKRFVALDVEHRGYLTLAGLESMRSAPRPNYDRKPTMDPSTLGPPDEGDATSYQPM